MNILYLQETDWLDKGPQQQHHLLERLSICGNKIVVIDYEVLWKGNIRKGLISKRIDQIAPPKACKKSFCRIIRPRSLRIPILNYISIVFSYGNEIMRQIITFKPDIIIGNGILTILIGNLMSRIKKIPFIYLMVDKIHQLIPYHIFKPFGYALEKIIHKNSSKIVTINEQLKNYCIRMGADSENTFVIRAGVETSLFKPNKQFRSEMRKEYHIKDEDLVLFFMGWLYLFSGLKEVILRMHELKNDSIKLVILGTGDLKEEILRLIEKYDMSNQIIFHEWIPYRELPKFVSMADICLLPAYKNKTMNEIVPIKLYEYLAMEKPVISTLLNGIFLEFKLNNGLFYINTPEMAVDKAIYMFSNNLIAETGRKGRNFIIKNCNWDKLLQDFVHILETV